MNRNLAAEGNALARNQEGNRWWLSATIIALTFLVYFPALRAPFIWDDQIILTDNPIVKASNGLYYAWFSTMHGDYIPLTTTSFWLEWRLWGNDPPGYRITNVFLQAFSAILIWRILRKLNIPGGFVAGLLFAVHPVCVTSVAWIAERKNTLSLLFYLLSVLFFLYFDEKKYRAQSKSTTAASGNGLGWYLASLGMLVFGLASKQSIVVLPAVLLLVIWWKRARVTVSDVKAVLPFFLLTAMASAVVVLIQQRALAGELSSPDSLLTRLIGGTWAIWFYLWKAAVPIGLSIVYPRWEITPSAPMAWIPGLLLGITAFVFWKKRQTWGRPGLFAFGYFVIALSPVLGLFNMVYFAYSRVGDHLQYLGVIGIVGLAGASLHELGKRISFGKPRQFGFALSSTLVVTVFALLGWQRANVFSSPENLWRDALKKNPGSSAVHYNLANVLDDMGRLDDAAAHFQKAVDLNPLVADAFNNLGYVFHRKGELKSAETNYLAALRANPNHPDARANLGALLLQRGDLDEAVALLSQALATHPGLAKAHYNLARALLIQSRFDKALSHLQAAMDNEPDFEQARRNLEAFALLQRQWAGSPANVLNDAAIVAAKQEQYIDALFLLDLARKTGVDAATTHRNIASIYLLMKQEDLAIQHNRQALRHDPDSLWALNNLAWMLAVRANPPAQNAAEAVSLAARAASLSDEKDPQILDTLSVCHAAAGDFEKAVETALKARSLATSLGQTDLASKLDKRLASFAAKKAIRE